jgi:hypothetical protein
VLTVEERFVDGNARLNIWQDTSGYVWVALSAYPIIGFCSDEPIDADSVSDRRGRGAVLAHAHD